MGGATGLRPIIPLGISDAGQEIMPACERADSSGIESSKPVRSSNICGGDRRHQFYGRTDKLRQVSIIHVLQPHAWHTTRDTEGMRVIQVANVKHFRDRQVRAGEAVIDEPVFCKSVDRLINANHVVGRPMAEAERLRTQSFSERAEVGNRPPTLLEHALDRLGRKRRLGHIMALRNTIARRATRTTVGHLPPDGAPLAGPARDGAGMRVIDLGLVPLTPQTGHCARAASQALLKELPGKGLAPRGGSWGPLLPINAATISEIYFGICSRLLEEWREG